MTTDVLTDRLPDGIYLRTVIYDAARASRWRSWLSAEERACVEGFGAESRRREFVTGRAAARQLLAGCLDTTPERVPLRRAEDEAVDVEEGGWHLSIAHSGPRALAVCAQHPVGVDLEHIEPRDPGIAEFLFRPEDRGLVDRLPYESDEALVLCWTLKEAVLKARRSGFRTSPKDLRLSVEAEARTAEAHLAPTERWRLLYEPWDDYWGAVAVPGS